jgi:hypothetical protein
MIRIRTLCTFLAMAWLVLACCPQLLQQCQWPELAQAADLAAKWTWTHWHRGGMVALLAWHLVGGLGGKG